LHDGAPGPEWGDPPAAPAPAEGEVHLWRLALNRRDAAATDFLSLLSPDERARARRFFFAEHRRQFVLARGWLRTVLGRYLHTPPGALGFRYGERGKPELVPANGSAPVSFNLAHTDALVVVAVTRGRAVGVDVERVRVVAEAEAIAERLFSPRERIHLQLVSPADRAETFFRFWTAKEACTKALGGGLDENLRHLDLAAANGATVHHVRLAAEAGRIVPCRLANFAAAPDHLAAVALVDG
jgi:4'-phosphopantetheinyl transferase